jgi:hypothetical protein
LNKSEIVNILKENQLSEVEVLRVEEDMILINFYFDFDKDVLQAAKAYADEECEEEKDSESWINDYYLPYLYDYANDEVLEVMEDITEELDIEGEVMAIQMSKSTADYVQFMALFTEEDSNLTIEEAVKDFMS